MLVNFCCDYDEYPEITLGPFVWVEMIGGMMFGCVNENEEAIEIAGFNDDCTWDASTLGQSKTRYTWFTVIEPRQIGS